MFPKAEAARARWKTGGEPSRRLIAVDESQQGESQRRNTADSIESIVRKDVDLVRDVKAKEPFVISTERELAALAAALSGDARLPLAERALVPRGVKFSRRSLADIRARIRAGHDPLGDFFSAIRSQVTRRDRGATYTPAAIVSAMTAWAASEPTPPIRIVDPGAGSGRFLMAAAQVFPKAKLYAIDVDPLATLMLRANAAVLGFSRRLTIELGDYRTAALPVIAGATLFIGNPPYVRHHEIEPRWKAWLSDAARGYGFSASGLAGLHVHFFVRTHQLARPGDFGAFITAAEWLDVNYGSVVRQMLADGLGGAALHLIAPKAMPFTGTLSTGAITCFRVGRRPDQLTVRTVDSLDTLSPLSAGRAVAWRDVERAPRWSVFLRDPRQERGGDIELGEMFRVHRGQVTGCNAAWIAAEQAASLPVRFLFPTVTKARELFAAGHTLASSARLRRVVDLPVDLDELTPGERRAVDEFLLWVKRLKADKSFIATHRRAWWSVGLRLPAPILCTYMARQAPAFVRNLAGARLLNIAHGLYPRDPLPERDLMAILTYLRAHTDPAGGRVYAGGLIKFEPKELERIRLPRLEDIHGYLAEGKGLSNQVVARRAAE